MDHGQAFGGEATDTREEIMYATFAAIQKHGYAGVSISRIAAETDLAKSSFYHHFDGKDDILLSFADFIVEEFARGLETETTENPLEELYAFLTLLLGVEPTERDAPDYLDINSAYFELRSQAIHDPAYREKFTETSDRFLRDFVAIIEAGIEADVFEDVDPQGTASFILTLVDGIIFNTLTRTDDPREQLWAQLDDYLRANVFRGELPTDDGYKLGDSMDPDGPGPVRWQPAGESDAPEWRTGDTDGDSEE